MYGAVETSSTRHDKYKLFIALSVIKNGHISKIPKKDTRKAKKSLTWGGGADVIMNHHVVIITLKSACFNIALWAFEFLFEKRSINNE